MNIVTFDIEEWFIYNQYDKGGKDYFLPILDKYLTDILSLLELRSTSATFFCLGVVARDYPDVIKRIASKGHDIGCHSDVHTNINAQNSQTFKNETIKAIDSLEQVTGKKVTMYRAPAFSVTEQNKWALEILIELGVNIDSSIFPTNRSFGGFPSFNGPGPSILNTPSGTIKEFPISYADIFGKRFVFAGGGYFRFFPYNIIEQLMMKSDYNLSYFHIRDFDSKQKAVYSMRYFKSYYGIKGAWSKFERVMNKLDFISLHQADGMIDWTNVPQLEL